MLESPNDVQVGDTARAVGSVVFVDHLLGPIIAIVMALQQDVDYPFFIFYRRVLFPALLIQICLRLAQDKDPDFRKTALLVIVAVLQSPIRIIYFGVAWPWWIVNGTTIIISFVAIAEVRDARLRNRTNQRRVGDAKR